MLAIREIKRAAICLSFAISCSTIVLIGAFLRQASYAGGDTVFEGPNPTNFPACKLRNNDGQSFTAKPHFVVRLPDHRGLPYGFNDNYTLPFPTPWVANTGGTCPASPNACVVLPDVYHYEQKLVKVPGVVHHQFKVHEVTTVTAGYKGKPNLYSVQARDWFYNGTQDYNALAQMNAVTSQYANNPTVASSTLTCVYVLQLDANGSLKYSGHHSMVGQAHDPINPPH